MKTEYYRMTARSRKVAIARNVIRLVNGGVLTAKSLHGYLKRTELNEQTPMPPVIFKENIVPTAEKCFVCVLGAMAVGRIAGFGGVEIDTGLGVARCDMEAALEDAFNEDELRELENCFEGNDFTLFNYFYKDHRNDTNRLLAMMQNIIDHKGEFKPHVRYVVNYVTE